MAEVHVSTWTELHDALNNQSGVTVYLDNDIDCNDEIPDGTDEYILLISPVYIYGNGHAIRNFRRIGASKAMFSSKPGYSGIVELNNINFENMIIDTKYDSDGVFEGYQSSSAWVYRFNNCRFSSKILRGRLFSGSRNNSFLFNQCSIKAELENDGNVFYNETDGYRASYNYYLKNSILNVTKGSSALTNIILQSTKIKGSYSSIQIHNYSSSPSSPGFLNAESVIDADVTGDVTLYNSNTSTYPVTAVLVNSDRVTGTIANGLLQATSAQMTDAAYLDSIGFPIGVDD